VLSLPTSSDLFYLDLHNMFYFPRTSHRIATCLILTSFYLDLVPHVTLQLALFYFVLFQPHTSHRIATSLVLSRTSTLQPSHITFIYLAQCHTSASQPRICSHSFRKCSDKSSFIIIHSSPIPCKGRVSLPCIYVRLVVLVVLYHY
jgi:hypothetical protein